jgi:hypothetical protein
MKAGRITSDFGLAFPTSRKKKATLFGEKGLPPSRRLSERERWHWHDRFLEKRKSAEKGRA